MKAKRSGDTGITWTWKALTNKFLEYQKPKLKAKYRQQYEHYLRLPEFSRIDGMPVSEVRLRDLEMLRDYIHLNHAPSAVHRALTQSKRMLSWAWKYHATAAGLEETQAEWWTRWSFEYKTNTRTHAPTIEEIARTIVIAEEFQHLADGEQKPTQERSVPCGASLLRPKGRADSCNCGPTGCSIRRRPNAS